MNNDRRPGGGNPLLAALIVIYQYIAALLISLGLPLSNQSGSGYQRADMHEDDFFREGGGNSRDDIEMGGLGGAFSPGRSKIDIPRAHDLSNSYQQLTNSTKIHILEGIAEGGFSYVYSATSNGTSYALKQIICQSPDIFKACQGEVRIHEVHCQHDNLLRLIDYKIDRDGYCLLLFPFHPNTLTKIILPNPTAQYIEPPALSLPDALRILIGVAEGLAHLHAREVAHLDVKVSTARIGICDPPSTLDSLHYLHNLITATPKVRN